MIQVIMTSGGIGDALFGLQAVMGLKEQGEDVVYCVRPNAFGWVKLFYDKVVMQPVAGLKTYYPYRAYDLEVNHGRLPIADRVALYCGCCGTKPALPKLRVELKPTHLDGRNCLSPVADWHERVYPHWFNLATLLWREHETVVLDRHDNRCASIPGVKAFGWYPQQVASLLKAAPLVISNDSMIAHLSCLLGTKTAIIAGPTESRHIFGHFPNVIHIQGFHLTPEEIVEQLLL